MRVLFGMISRTSFRIVTIVVFRPIRGNGDADKSEDPNGSIPLGLYDDSKANL